MWHYRFRKDAAIAVITMICLLAAGLVTVIYVNAVQEGQLRLTLNGDSIVHIEPGQTFEDPGAVAVFADGEAQQSVTVQRSGAVDASRLGVYLLKYEAVYEGQVVTAYRSVRVEDTTPPQIVLTENEHNYTMPGQPYAEEGFTATDNVDGDITGLVRRSERDGVVTYAVRDRAGNQTVTQRRIRYKDTQAPAVSIRGNLLISLTVGQAYQEPGYSAVDNLEGDITAYVTVAGSVDTQKPGVYTLRYHVKDTYGNLGAAERIVCVLPEDGLQAVPPNGKVIYLTFDDGPGPYTDQLLDVLAKYDVKATFFVVNTGMISKAERIAKEGHTVAIHTMSHRYQQIYASDEAYFADLYGMQEIIEKYTGQKTMLLRFPGGSSNTVSKNYSKGIMTRLTAKLPELGFRYFDWNVDSKDAGGAKTSEQVLANVIAGIGNKSVSIVLQHDIYRYSVDAVEGIILWGLANGYTFAPLTEGSPVCQHDVNN